VALKVFTSARAALESVRGTDLTPTRLIYAEEFTHSQEVATIRPTEMRNSYSPVFSASAGPERNTFGMSGRMSYDDAVWFGNLFFKAIASGTGGGDPYTWTFLPTNTSDDLKTATVQLGYTDTLGASAPGVKLNYLMGQTLTLRWEKNDDGAMTFDAQFLSAKAAAQIAAFTGSLTDRTVTLASCNNTVVYSDAGGTIGSTADDNIIAVEWTLDLGPVPLYTLDGTTAAKAMYRPNHRTWTASVTRQYSNDTHWDDYVDKTEQKLRIKTSTGATREISLDLYGTYTAREWSEVDGIITEVLTLEPIYNVTATADHIFKVINGVSAIT
jgi:hypothetical protein